MPGRILPQADDAGSVDSGSSAEVAFPIAHLTNDVEEELEYHTSSSQASLDLRDHAEDMPPSADFLPPEILKPLPSPAQSLVLIPHEHMTRQQKRSQRNRSRQTKKEVWEKLRKGTEGTGTLEAGRVAQLKRGIELLKKDGRVKQGRIEKPGKKKMSGRQLLMEDRKRAAVEKGLLSPERKGPKKSRAKVVTRKQINDLG